MISLLICKMQDKVGLKVEQNVTDLNKYLASKNYTFYDTVLIKGNSIKPLFKNGGKYYVVGKIENNGMYVKTITLLEITRSIHNPNNRL